MFHSLTHSFEFPSFLLGTLLLNPALQIAIKTIKAPPGLLAEPKRLPNKPAAHGPAQHTRELLAMHEGRAAGYGRALLKAEYVLTDEDAVQTAAPSEAGW